MRHNFDAVFLKEVVDRRPDRVYVCGPEQMVETVKGHLDNLGFSPGKIFFLWLTLRNNFIIYRVLLILLWTVERRESQSLSVSHQHDVDQKQQRTTNPSHDIHETPKKKIVINRRVVPKITIRVDELIRDTFHGLANDRLRYVTDSEDVVNNKILIDYIMAIYETYDIEDPLRKYKENVPLMTHQEEEPEE